MKTLIQASQWLIIILILFVLFTILVYHGSGHKIPLNTDLKFAGIVLSLIVIYIILMVVRRRL